MLGSTKNASADLSPLGAWLTEVDAGAVVTPAGIKFGVEKVEQFLPLIRASLGGFGPPQPGRQQSLDEMLNLVERGLKPFATEVTHLAYGVMVDDKLNLHLSARAVFATGGDWATTAEGIRAPKEGVLAGLPGGPFAVAYGLTLPQALRESFGAADRGLDESQSGASAVARQSNRRACRRPRST